MGNSDFIDYRNFDIRQEKSVIQEYSTFQMRPDISKYVLFSTMLLITFSLSAQKNVRKNVREGNKAYQEQKYTEASKLYREAIKENPKSMEANFNLGNAFYRQKQWDKSIEQMNHYLMLEKNDPVKMASAWHNIGNALLQKKEIDKAIEAYKNALRLNPNDEETRYNLAVAQKIKQDQQQNNQNNQNNNKNQDKNQQQQQQQQQQQDQQNKNQKPEKSNEPEQMSQSNARQVLQAIEQDEKETQQKVQQIKAQERQQKAEENRRQNKDW